jgi:hypothetical protein
MTGFLALFATGLASTSCITSKRQPISSLSCSPILKPQACESPCNRFMSTSMWNTVGGKLNKPGIRSAVLTPFIWRQVVKNPLSPVEHPGGVGVNNELFEESLELFVVRVMGLVLPMERRSNSVPRLEFYLELPCMFVGAPRYKQQSPCLTGPRGPLGRCNG